MTVADDGNSRAQNGEIDPADPVALAKALIRCPSVTPLEGGALDLLEKVLTKLGFACTRLPFSTPDSPKVDNLHAVLGSGRPRFCFAGHTDVVPPGDEAGWSSPPFEPTVEGGELIGRGAADMKGSIAAFVAATARLTAESGPPKGGISLLITGDEEGPAVNGTVRMLDWLRENDLVPDHCLVGEPTNQDTLGDMIKIGRRGSFTGRLTVTGRQGHVAYPHRADNPVPKLARILDRLCAEHWDDGTEHFQPTNLEVTTVDIGNRATNVIPGEAHAVFNIRFNDRQTPERLEARVREICDTAAGDLGGRYRLDVTVGGEAFLTAPGDFTDLLQDAVAEIEGEKPALTTTGGTSDARFIKSLCPVAEFGLVGKTMHQVNERVPVADIENLTAIYLGILRRYFARSW